MIINYGKRRKIKEDGNNIEPGCKIPGPIIESPPPNVAFRFKYLVHWTLG